MGRRNRQISKHLGHVLLACFALNALGFLASAAILESSQRGIGTDADLLVQNSAPSVAYLSAMRTHVWRLQTLVSLAVRKGTSGPTREMMQTSRSRLGDAWNRYMELPPFADEQPLQRRMQTALAEVESSLDAVDARLQTGDLDGASALLDGQLQPSVSSLDEELSAGIEFHRLTGRVLAQQIASTRSQAGSRAVLLIMGGLVFAGAAALVAILIVRQNARLLEAQVDELGQFAGRVAHDIRSPLTAIGLVLERTVARMGGDPELRRLLDRGTSSVRRIQAMLGGLLEFAKAGAQPEPGVHCELANTVAAVLDELEPVAQERGVELRAERTSGIELAASAGVVMSLLSNLVNNAIKYMGEVPVRRVTVRARVRDHMARIEVADTGRGVASEVMGRVFEPYVRGVRATEPGHGLGLATVRRLVEAHGGSVGVQSHEGEGALFWVELPCDGKPAGPSLWMARWGRRALAH